MQLVSRCILYLSSMTRASYRASPEVGLAVLLLVLTAVLSPLPSARQPSCPRLLLGASASLFDIGVDAEVNWKFESWVRDEVHELIRKVPDLAVLWQEWLRLAADASEWSSDSIRTLEAQGDRAWRATTGHAQWAELRAQHRMEQFAQYMEGSLARLHQTGQRDAAIVAEVVSGWGREVESRLRELRVIVDTPIDRFLGILEAGLDSVQAFHHLFVLLAAFVTTVLAVAATAFWPYRQQQGQAGVSAKAALGMTETVCGVLSVFAWPTLAYGSASSLFLACFCQLLAVLAGLRWLSGRRRQAAVMLMLALAVCSWLAGQAVRSSPTLCGLFDACPYEREAATHCQVSSEVLAMFDAGQDATVLMPGALERLRKLPTHGTVRVVSAVGPFNSAKSWLLRAFARMLIPRRLVFACRHANMFGIRGSSEAAFGFSTNVEMLPLSGKLIKETAAEGWWSPWLLQAVDALLLQDDDTQLLIDTTGLELANPISDAERIFMLLPAFLSSHLLLTVKDDLNNDALVGLLGSVALQLRTAEASWINDKKPMAAPLTPGAVDSWSSAWGLHGLGPHWSTVAEAVRQELDAESELHEQGGVWREVSIVLRQKECVEHASMPGLRCDEESSRVLEAQLPHSVSLRPERLQEILNTSLRRNSSQRDARSFNNTYPHAVLLAGFPMDKTSRTAAVVGSEQLFYERRLPGLPPFWQSRLGATAAAEALLHSVLSRLPTAVYSKKPSNGIGLRLKLEDAALIFNDPTMRAVWVGNTAALTHTQLCEVAAFRITKFINDSKDIARTASGLPFTAAQLPLPQVCELGHLHSVDTALYGTEVDRLGLPSLPVSTASHPVDDHTFTSYCSLTEFTRQWLRLVLQLIRRVRFARDALTDTQWLDCMAKHDLPPQLQELEQRLLARNFQLCHLQRSVSPWGECKKICPGERHRTIDCVNNRSAALFNHEPECCRLLYGAPPATEEACDLWQYEWKVGDWTTCPHRCLWQTRPEHCERCASYTDSRGRQPVDDSLCLRNVGPKPDTRRECSDLYGCSVRQCYGKSAHICNEHGDCRDMLVGLNAYGGFSLLMQGPRSFGSQFFGPGFIACGMFDNGQLSFAEKEDRSEDFDIQPTAHPHDAGKMGYSIRVRHGTKNWLALHRKDGNSGWACAPHFQGGEWVSISC